MMKPVYLAEDEDVLRKMVVRIIGMKIPGVVVRETDSGLSLVEMVRLEEPGFILTDNDMRDGAGIGVKAVKEIRSFNGAVPIYGCSGRSEVEKDFLEAGANGFFEKPYKSTMEVAQIIATYLNSKH